MYTCKHIYAYMYVCKIVWTWYKRVLWNNIDNICVTSITCIEISHLITHMAIKINIHQDLKIYM